MFNECLYRVCSLSYNENKIKNLNLKTHYLIYFTQALFPVLEVQNG